MIEVKLIPSTYQGVFQWGHFQKVRIFIINRLKKQAVFIREIEMKGQLPDKIQWYAGHLGDISFKNSQNTYIHHLLAPSEVSPIFAGGLLLPGQRLRFTTGIRMHSKEQCIQIKYNICSLEKMRRYVYFPQDACQSLVSRYVLPTPKQEKNYYRYSSIPEDLLKRIVVIPELDNIELQTATIAIPIKLANLKIKTKIEKIISLQKDSLCYYCFPIDQWFIQSAGKFILIKKLHGTLQPVEIPPFDLRILDIIECNPNHEVMVKIEKKMYSLLTPLGIPIQENFCYLPPDNLLDIIEIMKRNLLTIKLSVFPQYIFRRILFQLIDN